MHHDRQRLAARWQTELDLRAVHPVSARVVERAVQHMRDGLPMLWMALTCPATIAADVGRHTPAFRAAVASLHG